ncbi:NIF-domain-containing protein [Metschnikowia bicuspidata var. bicuspidata NRRL YB-4993]|uniref:NIF-domain-containing protein n=1 Tax=Metschnikowia bicuspidata var. bicuspidata NRRL YB-4993 TaxID=869754 RepID=A0A1A0HIE5_9ASCO|nr:NIF-domain-containing protein [Metschnikowia bicuspidata var. bicuspidata NRRL YB-4993]OBA23771.1 NIF-domain-containing protein [Metschnikowia bicuspidata var. bicuspidata NRRL YB-4993]
MNSLKKLVVSLEPLYPSAGSPNPETCEKLDYEEAGPLDEPISLASTSFEPILEENEAPRPESLWRSARALVALVLHALFVRPILLAWLLASFPFTYVFGSEYQEAAPSEMHASLAEDIHEKTALLKEEKILANNIKSPTASKYILPPPPRLFPLSRNPEKRRKKKTLVLDLDETLIHSLSRGAPRSFGSSGSSHTIELRVNNVSTLYYVYKRPFCDFFLKEVSKWFELQIFTASVKEYADPIIDWLESDIIDYKNTPQGELPKVFTKRYYRSDCTFRSGVGYIKNLSTFFAKEDELKNVIILDNSPVSYALHEDNAVMIEGWINDQSDRDLLNILPMLYSLSICIDVRFILGLRSGEKLFENS